MAIVTGLRSACLRRFGKGGAMSPMLACVGAEHPVQCRRDRDAVDGQDVARCNAARLIQIRPAVSRFVCVGSTTNSRLRTRSSSGFTVSVSAHRRQIVERDDTVFEARRHIDRSPPAVRVAGVRAEPATRPRLASGVRRGSSPRADHGAATPSGVSEDESSKRRRRDLIRQRKAKPQLRGQRPAARPRRWPPTSSPARRASRR